MIKALKKLGIKGAKSCNTCRVRETTVVHVRLPSLLRPPVSSGGAPNHPQVC